MCAISAYNVLYTYCTVLIVLQLVCVVYLSIGLISLWCVSEVCGCVDVAAFGSGQWVCVYVCVCVCVCVKWIVSITKGGSFKTKQC